MDIEPRDLIVIGGGSAGYAAARTAREAWNKVAIADGADEPGGLCILRGGMPSKTLIYSAEVLHLARHGTRLMDAHRNLPGERTQWPANPHGHGIPDSRNPKPPIDGFAVRPHG